MAIDATFWVAVSFVIFFGALIYFKIPQKVTEILDKMISDINLLRISLIFWGIFKYISPPKKITKETATQKVASIAIIFISVSFR